MSRRYRAALVGYYGFGNLGDELLLRASLEALGRCGVSREDVVILSNDPEATMREHGVASVNRWQMGAVCRALASSDTLLLGGGGLFQDSTSLRSCLWYWGVVRLARLCGARPWALGQSIGPLRRRAARFLTRDALRSCSVLQLRDEPSLEWAGRLGLEAMRGADLALTLQPCLATPHDEGERLLVNLRPAEGIERFVDLAAGYVAACPGEAVGVALAEEDRALLEKLRAEGRLRLSRVVRVTGLEDAAALWGGACRAVGMRLHFAVLSALFGTPLAVLPYAPKTAAFGAWVGAPLDGEGRPTRPLLPQSAEEIRRDVDGLCRGALGEENFQR